MFVIYFLVSFTPIYLITTLHFAPFACVWRLLKSKSRIIMRGNSAPLPLWSGQTCIDTIEGGAELIPVCITWAGVPRKPPMWRSIQQHARIWISPCVIRKSRRAYAGYAPCVKGTETRECACVRGAEATAMVTVWQDRKLPTLLCCLYMLYIILSRVYICIKQTLQSTISVSFEDTLLKYTSQIKKTV